MEICEDNHDEIVHTSRHCPLCEALDVYRDAMSEIDDLKGEIDDLNYKIEQEKT